MFAILKWFDVLTVERELSYRFRKLPDVLERTKDNFAYPFNSSTLGGVAKKIYGRGIGSEASPSRIRETNGLISGKRRVHLAKEGSDKHPFVWI